MEQSALKYEKIPYAFVCVNYVCVQDGNNYFDVKIVTLNSRENFEFGNNKFTHKISSNNRGRPTKIPVLALSRDH